MPVYVSSAAPCSCYYTSHNSIKTASLRRISGGTVVITHPCHPFSGKSVHVHHFRPKDPEPSIMVEFPDGSIRTIPVSWTDQSPPKFYEIGLETGLRLSPFALLEVVQWLQKIREGD